ncbi:MAG: hypothetical protein COT45_02295 [bacterium (Candidatus Stahlbacteria) CG08_land_8_20_14_0_20_40_26]|nr:MAG: hypothetical protein COX49_05535 [bacterium (Candidatus Stahlbacteria) CG23_combo_of_CG06-09_8_20_14_all_40_9]PIS25568.1 MAG: hypothetical protein COT45_02295 [bacterium (Candidatus Stahlbacteria) CG08_land_8_20_14_0_20_40_26]
MKETVAIVGIGRVGTSIGVALCSAGYRIIGLSSRGKKDSPLFSVCKDFSIKPYEVTGLADIVFLTVPDDVIEEVCRKIARFGGFKDSSLVIHTSGALSSDILSSAEGCRYLSIHPVKLFTSLCPVSLKGVYFSIEGSDTDTGIRIVKDIGGIPFLINREDKLLYHAVLSFSSSHLTGLIGLEVSILERAGLDKRLAILLARDTLKNIDKDGVMTSFAGPVRRIDKGTIKKEIEALKGVSRIAVDTYRLLTRLSVYVERELGVINKEDADSLMEILGGE